MKNFKKLMVFGLIALSAAQFNSMGSLASNRSNSEKYTVTTWVGCQEGDLFCQKELVANLLATVKSVSSLVEIGNGMRHTEGSFTGFKVEQDGKKILERTYGCNPNGSKVVVVLSSNLIPKNDGCLAGFFGSPTLQHNPDAYESSNDFTRTVRESFYLSRDEELKAKGLTSVPDYIRDALVNE